MRLGRPQVMALADAGAACDAQMLRDELEIALILGVGRTPAARC